MADESELLAGLKFFVAQRVPSRSRLLNLIRHNAGTIVPREKDADFRIADPDRLDCPPNSISYAFVEDAVARNEVPEPGDYACIAGSGPARPASSAAVPRKKTREMFSAEDNRILLAHLRKIVLEGGRIGGNVPYKDLAAKNGRHSWMSWRSRWVDTLSKLHSIDDLLELNEDGTRAVAPQADEQVKEGAQQQTEDNGQSRSTPASEEAVSTDDEPFEMTDRHHRLVSLLEQRQVKDQDGQIFNAEDITHLMQNLKELPSVLKQDWAQAWSEFAAATGDSHTGYSWQCFYAHEVRALLDELNWNHKLEDRTPRQSPVNDASIPNPSPSDQSAAGSEYFTPGRAAAGESLKRKAPTPADHTSHKKQKTSVSSVNEDDSSQLSWSASVQSSSRRVETLQSASSLIPQTDASESSHHSAVPSQERLDWIFEHAKQKKKVASQTSASQVESSAETRLTFANLASQSEQQTLAEKINRIVPSLAASEISAEPGNQAHAQSVSQLHDGQLLSSLDQTSAPQRHVQFGQGFVSESFDSALLGHGQSSRVHSGDDSFDPDFTVPSPAKPSRPSQSQQYDTAAEYADERAPRSNRRSPRMDTQAILNAETQALDFSVPSPVKLRKSRAQSSQDITTSSPASARRATKMESQEDAAPVDEDMIEAFFADNVARGYSESEIASALHMTSARPYLASFVLLCIQQGRPLPDDIPGIWREDEDEELMGGDSRRLKSLEARHGTDEFHARLHFLEEIANDSQ